MTWPHDFVEVLYDTPLKDTPHWCPECRCNWMMGEGCRANKLAAPVAFVPSILTDARGLLQRDQVTCPWCMVKEGRVRVLGVAEGKALVQVH